MSVYPVVLFTLLISLASTHGTDEYNLWKQGRQHWYNSEWREAAAAHKLLVEKYPDSPRRCKSENYLAYCYYKMDEKTLAFQVFSTLIENGDCRPETLDDARTTRLKIAYELVDDEPAMKQVLLDGLNDSNSDICLASAVWLSQLGDPAGLDVFFRILENEGDQDRKDTAAKHILRLGSVKDKERLSHVLETLKKQNTNKGPTHYSRSQNQYRVR